ncbi:hypothetical protein EN837_25485 [bacterium M00.F.Ca.ET.194.01.1.1]|nr:hypothetical protein EN837_25485 [bacterium M00.F.Ca.ET.194.01.1.1]TGS52160.1 hypothetical protein EN822_25150 [bacterium M00.F.Ca.ET.179.01.1.1]TGV43308.1 hypothetical protein EN811_25150 [bacterium M00.F.Ca.ET.168.01.1.1]
MNQLLMTTAICLVQTVAAMTSEIRLGVNMTSFAENTALGETVRKALCAPFERMIPDYMASYAK